MTIDTKSLAAACFALTVAALSAGACTEAAAAIDEPCEGDEDCAEGLTCDSHGGETTCQEPHGHQGATSTSTTTASGTGAPEARAVRALEAQGARAAEAMTPARSTAAASRAPAPPSRVIRTRTSPPA